MITPHSFINELQANGIGFYAGVPDSLLGNLCAYIMDNVAPERNIIAANEGGAVGLAAGHYLATGGIPMVYMQNSGEGNAVNPLLSLTDKEVYNIPLLLLVGWRGMPGVHDEPQHVKQGRVTTELLDAMGIKWMMLAQEEAEMRKQVEEAVGYMLRTKEAFAFVVRKDTFATYSLRNRPAQDHLPLPREEAVCRVARCVSGGDMVVSTTGMISRELFEFRERERDGHFRDFLTVGSMGHASQIALGIALEQRGRLVWCFDGDGAALMHMGAMAIIGSRRPGNFIHVVFNNGAHDSVGGQPTVGFDVELCGVARSCGYPVALSVDSSAQLDEALAQISDMPKPLFLEIRVKRGCRSDLGRPTTTPIENKDALMDFLLK